MQAMGKTIIDPGPTINPENHGAQVIVVGAIFLATSILMMSIAFYNRYNAKTMHHLDSPMILFGAVGVATSKIGGIADGEQALNIASYALLAIAVAHGFGRHTDTFDDSQLRYLKQLFLSSILIFFVSHGVMKISYNMLVRQTAQGARFSNSMDAFSAFIVFWTLVNVIVISIYLKNGTSPKKLFFLVSGAFSILIVIGQLFAFFWLIWRTKAKPKVKIRWSLSVGTFVPLCITAIIVRLAYTPEDYFAGDWTFHDIVQSMLFQIELNIVTVTVLAPNLPVFFQKTSTGGVFFLPGEVIGGSRSSISRSNSYQFPPNSNQFSPNSYQLRWSKLREGTAFDGKAEDCMTTTATRVEREDRRKQSFGSDDILVRRSVDIGTEPAERDWVTISL